MKMTDDLSHLNGLKRKHIFATTIQMKDHRISQKIPRFLRRFRFYIL